MLDAFPELTSRQEEILQLAAQGNTLKEVASELGITLSTVRNHLQTLYENTGLRNLHGATAYFGNRLGLQGTFINKTMAIERAFSPEGITVPKGLDFHIGKVRHPATLVSSEFRSTSDLMCVVADDLYKPPLEIEERIEEFREKTVNSARSTGQILYEVPNDLLVVNRLDTETEFYERVTLTLKRSSYVTSRAIHEHLTWEQKIKYSVDPFHLLDAALPLPLATSLHIVAGQPPQLIVNKRGGQLATYGRFFSAAVDSLGQASLDILQIGEQKVFDFRRTMLRESAEERNLANLVLGSGVDQSAGLEDRITLLGLIFDHRVMTFIIQGYLEIPEVDPEAVINALSRAKEGTYELLPFPSSGSSSQQKDLRNLCDHLTTAPWTPCASIGIVVWLNSLFGINNVYPLLGQRLRQSRKDI